MAKDGKTTFYRTAEGMKYHRDRQCYFLRKAVARSDVLSFRDFDPGIGKTLTLVTRQAAPRPLMSCSRCGR